MVLKLEAEQKVNSVVVGCGITGERFAKALVEQDTPPVLFDTNLNISARLADRFGILVASNLSEAVEKAQAVYICTPISDHAQTASQVLEQGKSLEVIFCEKPLTGSLKEALDIQKRVQEREIPFLLGNYYRFNSSINRAKQIVDSGEIGEVFSVDTSYWHDMRHLNEKTNWRKKEGFLYDGGVHPVDLARWVMGEKVKSVNAMKGYQVDDLPYPQQYSFNLMFESGKLAAIHLNGRVVLAEHGAQLTIMGTKGTIIAHNKKQHLEIHREGSKEIEKIKTPQGLLPIDRVVEIINNRIAGRSDKLNLLPDIDDAVESIRVLDAVERAVEARTTIDL